MIKDVKQDVIKVKYKGEYITIEVTKELSIIVPQINGELKSSPSNYAFLCLIRDEYIYKRDMLEKEKDIAYAEAWVYYKESSTPPLVNDMVDKKAMLSKNFVTKQEKYIKAVYKANQLISICKAYESREKLLQTLSSNIRKTQ